MVLLDAAAARAALDTLAVLLLGTALLSVLVRRLDYAIVLLGAQGALLAAAAAVIALTGGALHAAIAAGLTLTVKAVAIPGVLLYVLREVRLKREMEVVLPLRLALPAAVGLVLVAWYVVTPLSPLDEFGTRNVAPTAVTMLLIGLFTMMLRKKALSQVVGLVAMENGVYLAAIVATRGLPLTVELGVALDLLMGAVVMGVLARQISRTFNTVNTDRLRMLRG